MLKRSGYKYREAEVVNGLFLLYTASAKYADSRDYNRQVKELSEGI